MIEVVKVRDVMTHGVPKVDATASVLQAAKIINHAKTTGVAVFLDGKAVGMLTERSLLRRFVKLDRRPDEVKVSDVMTPFTKIDADATVKEAAGRMIENGLTRLGVFDGENLVGWVTLTDIARESSKQTIVDSLVHQTEAESQDEMRCPACHTGAMKKVIGPKRKFVFWECPECGYQQ